MITKYKAPHRVVMLNEKDSTAIALALDASIKLVNMELDKLGEALAINDSSNLGYQYAVKSSSEMVRHRAHLYELLSAIS